MWVAFCFFPFLVFFFSFLGACLGGGGWGGDRLISSLVPFIFCWFVLVEIRGVGRRGVLDGEGGMRSMTVHWSLDAVLFHFIYSNFQVG